MRTTTITVLMVTINPKSRRNLLPAVFSELHYAVVTLRHNSTQHVLAAAPHYRPAGPPSQHQCIAIGAHHIYRRVTSLCRKIRYSAIYSSICTTHRNIPPIPTPVNFSLHLQDGPRCSAMPPSISRRLRVSAVLSAYATKGLEYTILQC